MEVDTAAKAKKQPHRARNWPLLQKHGTLLMRFSRSSMYHRRATFMKKPVKLAGLSLLRASLLFAIIIELMHYALIPIASAPLVSSVEFSARSLQASRSRERRSTRRSRSAARRTEGSVTSVCESRRARCRRRAGRAKSVRANRSPSRSTNALCAPRSRRALCSYCSLVDSGERYS